jgi:3-oxoadipate enol-lactonase
MPDITVNGETLRYERAGEGPPLLLIHSLGTGAWLWRKQIHRWQTSFDVIAVDARGHGGSTHRGAVSVEAIAQDLLDALTSLKVGPAEVVAISMGGPIACHLWRLQPGAVSGLVIADSFARQGEAGRRRYQDLESVIADVGLATYAHDYALGTLLPGGEQSDVDSLVESIAGMDISAYLETAESVFSSDVAALMRTITAPVRIVVGAQDSRTPPALSEDIAELIPHSELVVIERAAHLANLDNPDGFHAAVDPFIRRGQA